MISIVERPSETGKLIYLNPRGWKCPQHIQQALFTEERAPEDYGQYDKPSKYPAGTVAELRRTGMAFTQYIMKQDDGRWRKLTPPFSYFSKDLPMAGLSSMHFTLTILYNPNNEQEKAEEENMTTMRIIEVSNTDVGKKMSTNPEWFRGKDFSTMATFISDEITSDVANFHEYKGTIHDISVGSTIQVQVPCMPILHLVKQPNGTWKEITVNMAVSDDTLLAYPYPTVTVIYKP